MCPDVKMMDCACTGAPQLSESGGSLQERKLANALLVMRWVD
jgi:hypothetical protein